MTVDASKQLPDKGDSKLFCTNVSQLGQHLAELQCSSNNPFTACIRIE